MALQAPLLQGHRDAKADSAGLNRKQKHSTYQSVKILWLETFYDYIFETSFCMEEWQLLEVGSQRSMCNSTAQMRMWRVKAGLTSKVRPAQVTRPTRPLHDLHDLHDIYLESWTPWTFDQSDVVTCPGKQQVEVFVQNSEWAAMDSSLALQ